MKMSNEAVIEINVRRKNEVLGTQRVFPFRMTELMWNDLNKEFRDKEIIRNIERGLKETGHIKEY